jgi:hypothetical protein
MRCHLAVALLGLAACGGGTSTSGPADKPAGPARPAWADTTLSPALAPLGWMVGAWQAESDASTETWTASRGALIGVGFVTPADTTLSFEVMIIHRDAGTGTVVLTAMPDGRSSVDFALTEQGESHATFTNLAHDFPKTIHYARTGDALTAKLTGDDSDVSYVWRAVPTKPAPPLEAADLAFADETARYGIDGWVRWFAEDGAMWRDRRVEGHDAVRALMGPAFADPAFELEWLPVASGLSAAGDLGFTVGRSTWPGTSGAVTASYVTVWTPQIDGAWLVLFDTGSPD